MLFEIHCVARKKKNWNTTFYLSMIRHSIFPTTTKFDKIKTKVFNYKTKFKKGEKIGSCTKKSFYDKRSW